MIEEKDNLEEIQGLDSGNMMNEDDAETGDLGMDTDNTSENELEAERQKNGELHDKYLRLNAEFDNFRRRTNKEKADLILYGNKDMLLNILPVYDDFTRALELSSKAEDKESVIQGMELIFTKFKQILEKSGLKEIEAKGKDFDSELHDAITTIPAQSVEMKGKVIDEIQKGYMLNDKILRHAKVVVGE